MKSLFFAILFCLPSFQSSLHAMDRLQNANIKTKGSRSSPKIVDVNILIDLSNEQKGSCHIRLADIYGAVIGAGGYRRAKITSVKPPYNELDFSFYCYSAGDGEWKKGMAVRFDNARSKWVKDMQGRIPTDAGAPPELGPLVDKATRVYDIQAVNSQGFVITEDDFIGDESRRERMFSYCLIREPKVLCGGGSAMRLADPKSNLLPYALRIIQSIEFID